MKKITLLILLLIFFSTTFTYAQTTDTETESVCATGSDSDPVTITLTPSDLTVNEGQPITAVSVSSATLGNSIYWGSWYSASITVTGGVSDGSVVSIENMAGLDLTGFTSVTMTSEDLDAYSDSVTMCLILSVTYVEPQCVSPADISFSNITTSSADISWTAGGSETLWNVEVVDVTAGGAATGSATHSGVTNPYTLTGLTSNNEYEVYIQADCGSGIVSAWVGPSSFTTACDAISTFPWTEDFESVTAPALPSCFSELNNNSDTDYWKTYSGYGTSGSNAAGM